MQQNQVTLPCTDYDASKAFYTSLGLTLIVDSPPRYARFECTAHNAVAAPTLSIEYVEGWTGGDWPLIYLECADLDAEYARLRKAGISFLSAPEMKSYLWKEADLRDPAGNRLRLFEAGDARQFPPWRVAPES